MTKDLFIDLNYRSGVSPSSCLHVRPNNELSSLMTNQHPITPPPELVWEWTSLANEEDGDEVWISITTQAARWGSDQELQACINFVYDNELCDPNFHNNLRKHRRPKPPSLKEQAHTELDRLIALIPTEGAIAMAEPLRRALEALPDA